MCKILELVNFSQKIGRKGRGKPTNQFFLFMVFLKDEIPLIDKFHIVDVDHISQGAGHLC